MKIINQSLLNSNYKLNEARLYFLDSYPYTINMFLIGKWYKVYNKDAQIVATIMNYKLFDDNYNAYLGNVCCWFPQTLLPRVINKLKEFKINYTTINTNDWSYEFYDWELNNNYNEFIKNEEKFINKETTNKNIAIEAKNINSSININKCIKIGDSVEIVNDATKEKEIYTILPTYYKFTPKSVSKNYKTFGMIEYKTELDYSYDVAKGEISSESPLAKELIKHREQDAFDWIDENGDRCKYVINRIMNNA